MHSFPRPPERDTIYEELSELSIEQVRNKYAKEKGLRYHIGNLLYTFFPQRWVSKIVKYN